MKALFALICACAPMITASDAVAEEDSRWHAPDGLFSLDFRAFGWSELSDSGDSDVVLGIEHRAFQVGGAMRTCFITEHRAPAVVSVSQQTLNALAMRTTGVSDSTGSPRTLDRLNIDGVLVSDATYDRPLYQHARWFYLSDGDEVIQFHIGCGASGRVSEEVSANITSMLQTLRFRTQQ